MKLTNEAIHVLQNSSRIKLRLALALDCSVTTINRYIKENNDTLTKIAALEIIRKETGWSDERIVDKGFAEPDRNNFSGATIEIKIKFDPN
jgi:hypothetical protein